MRPLRHLLFVGSVVLLLGSATTAAPVDAPRAPQESAAAQHPAKPLDPTTMAALERLATLIAERSAQADTARSRGDADGAQKLDAGVQELRMQFAALAARLDVREFESPDQAKKFDLRAELEELVRPLLWWMKDATSGPRQVADLKGRKLMLQERLATAQLARGLVERTREALPAGSPARVEAEREISHRWAPAIAALQDELLVAEASLARHLEDAPSLTDRVGNTLGVFVDTSGMSLLLAVLVFVLVLFGGRALGRRLIGSGSQQRSFTVRAAAVVLHATVMLLAMAAALLVPYLRDDWLLLAIGIIFLIGAGWVLMRTLPQLFEQVRLVLNVGGVREGERILIDGLPFRVASLRWYSRLENPDLQGGTLRVPLQFLVGQRSRESGPDEPWFPTRIGDVVTLADGTWGRVQTQTPEVVVVDTFGLVRSYPTADFLRQTPRNLSRGFAATASFVLAHRHVGEITTTLREALERDVRDAATAAAPAGLVRTVTVFFQSVQATGFELLAVADCDGAAAMRYHDIRRAMQTAFAAACARHGWTLPAAFVVAPPR